MTSSNPTLETLIRKEKAFARMVRRTISGIREKDPAVLSLLWLIEESLIKVDNPDKTALSGFEDWNDDLANAIGITRCREIGAQICAEENFTAAVARELLQEYASIQSNHPDLK